jgi:hypothetical protein
MSTASASQAAGIPQATAAAPVRHWLRLFRSELRIIFLRPRNLAMLALLAAAPVFLGIVLWVNTPAPGSGGGVGPGIFIGQIADNGVFLSLFAIYVLLRGRRGSAGCVACSGPATPESPALSRASARSERCSRSRLAGSGCWRPSTCRS